MENLIINIGGEDFTFTGNVLYKHMRKIEPLSVSMENKEIGGFDYMLKLSEILCISDNKEKVCEKIDNLGIKEIEKFTKDFEKIALILDAENKSKKK